MSTVKRDSEMARWDNHEVTAGLLHLWFVAEGAPKPGGIILLMGYGWLAGWLPGPDQ